MLKRFFFKLSLAVIGMVLVYGCAAPAPQSDTAIPPITRGIRFPAMLDLPSPNFEGRPKGQKIDMLILHYTGMQTAQGALERLRDPSAKVSAHYLVEENGAITRLVEEKNRAWHAGVAAWRGQENINERSIGIELVNPGTQFGYRPFPEAQMKALITLASGILKRHPIAPGHVLGHSDVAPLRKTDPGPLFDWKRLASEGIGAWPQISDVDKQARPIGDENQIAKLLTAIGYQVPDASGEAATKKEDTRKIIAAFQSHFRPNQVDGVVDEETTALLYCLSRAP